VSDVEQYAILLVLIPFCSFYLMSPVHLRPWVLSGAFVSAREDASPDPSTGDTGVQTNLWLSTKKQ